MTDKSSPMALRGTDVTGTKLKVAASEDADQFGDESPAKKIKGPCTKSLSVDGTDGFKTGWADAVRDVNQLLTKYSEVLRERAAIDASQVQELTDILTEAMNLESQLKEKKEHLRRALAIISDKLQS